MLQLPSMMQSIIIAMALLAIPRCSKLLLLMALLAIPRCSKLLLLMAAGVETCKCRPTNASAAN
jgi:hypothetical protein